jgi:HlyD family secretion protein
VSRRLAAAAVTLALAGQACQKAEPAPLYEKVPVERRDIVVAAIATGVIRPTLTFSVKSKAWGEIVEMPVQTGQEVKQGQLLARIDPRLPQNNLTQAQASLDKARAQLQNAAEQLKRSEALYRNNAIAETDYDAAKLADATAQAAVVTAEANFQTAKDAMEDTQVRAPITGTVLELDAVLGSVISSPTLGGGTVILKMANLDTVVDSVLVIETDVGRVQSGMPATITVDAFANRVFDGTVAMIVPQALVSQNATMFPVLLTIKNGAHLLKPGMNTRVNIHTGLRQAVLAVPNAALRTARDVDVGASVLGLDPQVVEQQLTAAQAAEGPPRTGGDTTAHADSAKARAGAPQGAGATGATFTMPNGRTITLPPGVTAEQVQAAFAKMRSGAAPTSAERALLAQLFQKRPGGGSQRSGQSTSYVVFALRAGKIMPVPIKTGLTDQDYIEVRTGLTDKDTVLVLPSASLVQSQQQFRQRFQNVTGGGLPGVRQQQQQAPSRSAPGR